MKTIRLFSSLLILLITLSCSKSDNAEAEPYGDANLEGVWTLVGLSYPDQVTEDEIIEYLAPYTSIDQLMADLNCEWITFDIRSDQSIVINQTDFYYDADLGDLVCVDPVTGSGTWQLEDDLLTFNIVDEDSEAYTFTTGVRFESGQLIIEDPGAFASDEIAPNELIFAKLGNG